ncbi:MAG TPA: LptE family protein [Gemmatimonadota bacterium]|nr:LptE family protein [Gemmatimonadota bacterium]
MSHSSRAYTTWLLASLLVPAISGCGIYSFTGGGGLPGHIESIAILPFDNRTTQFTLTQELTQRLTDVLPGRLGVKLTDEGSADAIVRGVITRYQESATNYQPDPAGPVIFQRRVDIAVTVEIFDTREEAVLWGSSSVRGAGEYIPDQQSEEIGRQLAIDNLVTAIIDGAQSQW